jgi:hypothetical protein
LKVIIQLLIAALVLNACVRGAESAWRYYSFKDAIGQEVLFSATEPLPNIEQRVVEIAGEYNIELADVEVTRERDQTTVTFAYDEDIPLVPKAYTRTQRYEDSITVRSLRAP